jgi:GNAT superfamily N-acetyltransferase
MTLSIRIARVDDRPELSRLIDESVRKLSAGHYTPRQIESALVHVFGVDTQLIQDGTYFVAEMDGRIVGCGGWSRRKTLFGGDQMKGPKDEDDMLDPATEASRIRAFFVHPAWSRRGVGRRLIEACEAAAQQAGFKRIELASTLPGVPLYAACGYAVVERTDVAMADGEYLPIVVMSKSISAPAG